MATGCLYLFILDIHALERLHNFVACMDAGEGREHDYMDVGGRAKQEARAEERKLSLHGFR